MLPTGSAPDKPATVAFTVTLTVTKRSWIMGLGLSMSELQNYFGGLPALQKALKEVEAKREAELMEVEGDLGTHTVPPAKQKQRRVVFHRRMDAPTPERITRGFRLSPAHDALICDFARNYGVTKSAALGCIIEVARRQKSEQTPLL